MQLIKPFDLVRTGGERTTNMSKYQQQIQTLWIWTSSSLPLLSLQSVWFQEKKNSAVGINLQLMEMSVHKFSVMVSNC